MRKAEAESIIGLRGLRRCISVFGVLKEPGIFTQFGGWYAVYERIHSRMTRQPRLGRGSEDMYDNSLAGHYIDEIEATRLKAAARGPVPAARKQVLEAGKLGGPPVCAYQISGRRRQPSGPD